MSVLVFCLSSSHDKSHKHEWQPYQWRQLSYNDANRPWFLLLLFEPTYCYATPFDQRQLRDNKSFCRPTNNFPVYACIATVHSCQRLCSWYYLKRRQLNNSEQFILSHVHLQDQRLSNSFQHIFAACHNFHLLPPSHGGFQLHDHPTNLDVKGDDGDRFQQLSRRGGLRWSSV